MSLQKKCMSGVTHQKYRLGVINKLVGEVDTITKEEQGEVQDLNKVPQSDICVLIVRPLTSRTF